MFRLGHQSDAVCQEERIRHLIGAREHIDEPGCGAGFPRAGCHDKQAFAVPLFEMRADRLDGLYLVIASCYLVVYAYGFEGERAAASIHQALQVVAGEDAGAGPLGRCVVVAEVRFEAVRKEDERFVPVARFEAFRVEPCLLQALFRVVHGAFCFHDRKGLAVLAIEDVVDISFAFAVGHAGHLDLGFDGVFGPTGVLKIEIDIASARFAFGDFIRVERLGVGGFRFRSCELRPEAANLFL